MKQLSILAIVACAALTVGCGSSGTTPGGTVDTGGGAATDTGGGGGSDATTGTDTGGGGGGDATGTTDTGGGGDNCSCAGKECGFIPGCPKSCGSCGAGQKCVNNKCEKKVVVQLKKFGEFCGPTKDCQPPPAGTASNSPAAQAYRDCLNAQCDTNLCYGGVCTKLCTILKDEKNNATGSAGDDGIEDSATNSECGDAATGDKAIHGSTYSCVQQLDKAQVQQGQSAAICVPSTSWKECKADSECQDTESCRLYFVYGALTSRCGPKSHSPGSTKGAGIAQSCNSNPLEGDVAVCTNDLCFSLGCSAFCNDNKDCVTDVGACKAGKCANGSTCKDDTDCSAWQCSQQQLSSNDPKKYGVCWPKNCKVNGDCPDDTFACRISYNGVQKPEGEPDPDDPTKVILPGWDNICVSKVKDGVKVGEACDPFSSDDDTTLKACENPFMCNNGNCSTLCETGKDCPKDMKCNINEAPLDLDNPDDGIYDVFLPYGSCTSVKGAGKACLGTKECGAGKHCKMVVEPVDLAAGATPVSYKYVANAMCVDVEAGKGDYGKLCGSASDGKGLGKLCNSGFCLNTTNAAGQAQPGFCVDLCGSKNDCAQNVSIYNQNYKSVCTSLRLSWNTTPEPEDDHFIPVCVPTNPNSSLSDCSKDKTCTKANEACLGYAITMSVDKPTKMEYLCSFVGNSPTQANQNPPQPTKKVGEECDLEATLNECTTGYCMPDVKNGKGYCSRVCNENSDCPTSDSMSCNKDYARIPRPDKANAGLMPLCMKAKSCIPCAYDYTCAGNYACTNVGGGGTLAKQVCAPSCATDKDCANADGGAKCVPAKDADGNEIKGKNVCAPGC